MTPRELGANMRKARRQAGLTLEQTCDELVERFDLSLTRSSLSRIELGEQKPLLGLVAALAFLYGVRPADFFGAPILVEVDDRTAEIVAQRMIEFQRLLDAMYVWQA